MDAKDEGRAEGRAGAVASPRGRITGVGGVFFRARDPASLSAWYRDVLGLEISDWGGAVLRRDDPAGPPAVAWNAFDASTDYFAPSAGAFMINYAVDDMDAILARIERCSVAVLERRDQDDYGRFAWVLDPEGNKVELWEPKRGG